jgi:predicted RNA methylase
MNRTKKNFDPLEQFFTDSETLKKVANIVLNYIDESFTFVDFSCGTNEFCHLLSQNGITTKSYDIDTSYVEFDKSNVQEIDWFDVKRLPQNKLAIGLNPPFGFKSQTANRFLEHALNISDYYPEYFFLILPTRCNLIKDFKNKYELVESVVLSSEYYNVKLETTTDFETTFFVFKLDLNKKEERTAKKVDLPEGFTLTPAKNKSETELRKSLVVRIDGRSSGSQYYLYEKGFWVRYHKNERVVTKCKNWKDLNMSLQCFTSITAPKDVNLSDVALTLKKWYNETYGENVGQSTPFHFKREDIRNVISRKFK